MESKDKERIVTQLFNLQQEFRDRNIPLSIEMSFNGHHLLTNKYTEEEIREYLQIMMAINLSS